MRALSPWVTSLKSWETGRLSWKILQSKANTDRGAADRATAASPAKSSRDFRWNLSGLP